MRAQCVRDVPPMCVRVGRGGPERGRGRRERSWEGWPGKARIGHCIVHCGRRRPSGQERFVPGAGNMVYPYFEGAESVSVTGLTRFQAFKGLLSNMQT